MRSTPPSRHWDGSLLQASRRRSLRLSSDSASRLLRCGQGGRCRDCGNRIEWYYNTDDRPVRLHPHELPAEKVPPTCHWHVSGGVAHPAGDGSGWCRLPHAMVCPARDPNPAAPELIGLRRALAVNTRRLIDDGAFVPPSVPPDAKASAGATCRPARPVVQLLYLRYMANHPVDEIQCVAQTGRRNRCTSPLLTPETQAGVWTQVPSTTTHGQLPLPGEVMALYSLSGPTQSNFAGAFNAALSTPSFRRPPMWRRPNGSLSTRFSTTSTSTPGSRHSSDVGGLSATAAEHPAPDRAPHHGS